MPETPRRERGAGKTEEHRAGHAAGSGPPSLPRPFRPAQPVEERAVERAPLPRDAAALPPPPAELWHIVDESLPVLGVALGNGARAAIDAHLRLLLAWNEHVNLTALRSAEQVARGHVLDSLSALPVIARLAGLVGGPGQRPSLLDVGSGGGFPGLPLAVTLPAGRAALVDSVRKKAAFLGAAGEAAAAAMRRAGEQPPPLDALAERAEDLADDPDQRGAWDIVVARAVGSLAEVVELALPLARAGGHVVAWKREAQPAGLRDEINAARRVLQAAGGGRPVVVAPDREGRAGLGEHRLVIVRKVRPTPDRFPRAPAERRRSSLLR